MAALWIAVATTTAHGQVSDRDPGSPTAGEIHLALAYGIGSEPPSAAADSNTAPPDRWLAMDKAKHLGGSALWTWSTQYLLVVKAGWTERDALPASVASAAVVGLAKEAYDWRLGPTGHFSRRDLVADAAGIGLAVGVILL
jgi:uncharacterized protein YfiM (DUF2279 family)